MSYNLYLKPRTGQVDRERLERYFTGREHYTSQSNEFRYENQDTGVNFGFEMDAQSPAPAAKRWPIALKVNLFRAGYFILEIEPEVTALVNHFDLMVCDPQGDAEGEEYRSDLLIWGWTHGNELAYAAYLGDADRRRKIASLPAVRLMEVWNWNRNRRQRQDGAWDGQFVAPIIFIRTNKRVATAAIWTDAIPSVIPPVDWLVIARKRLAPRRFLRRREDHALLAWDAALRVLARYGERGRDGAFALSYDKPPKDLVRFITTLPPDERPLIPLRADQVLDRELVEKQFRVDAGRRSLRGRDVRPGPNAV